MPEITGVRERRNRARISVDGEFWAEIDAAVAIESGLREGAEFSREVRDRLTRYGYLGETIDAVVLRLEELGYLDDAEFARMKAREKARRYGPRRVSVELKKSGVGETLA